MSEILENIKTRRSARNYKPDAIPEEDLSRIIEAGLYAASGMNRQDTIIIAVTNKELRDKLMRMNASIIGREASDPFYGAPVILIVLAKKDVPTHIYDGSLVIGNMMLEAHELGLGSCWIHRAKEEFESAEGKEILKSLNIDGEYEGIGHLAVGYVCGNYTETHEIKKGRVFFVK